MASDACLPLDKAIAFDDLEKGLKDTYGYCTANKKSFLGKHTQSCLTCLHSSTKHVYLSNCTWFSSPMGSPFSPADTSAVLTVLTGGCAYKPEAGSLLRYTGDVFSNDDIRIQSPNQDNDDADTQPGESKKQGSSSGLSREFIIGIVVGVCVLFAMAIALFFIYYLRFRKRDAVPDPDHLFPPSHRQSLRHQRSVDPDPALFSNTVHAGSRLYPWSSDSDGESLHGGGHGADYFDFVNATAMAHRPEAEGQALPMHAAYKPYIRSKNRVAGGDGDGATMTTDNWSARW